MLHGTRRIWTGAAAGAGLLAAALVGSGCSSRSGTEAVVAVEPARAGTSPAAAPAAAGADLPCAPGATCLAVDADGKPNPTGTSLAQCQGRFADFVVPATLVPADYPGPWFKLSQDYPAKPPRRGRLPWKRIDFRASAEKADRYLYALRDYALEGMVAADFEPSRNTVRRWFHIPMMNFGPGRREIARGVTRERRLVGPELGLKPGVGVNNYAIGFYNEIGAATIGKVWLASAAPDITLSQFPEGAMVFKVLFSTARAADFQDPPGDILSGAPEWQIATGGGALTTIRLLQMDVAAKDARAGTTGWVYGTFAYDRDAGDADPWRRLRPVGLSWGNDPGYTPADQAAGKPLQEAYVSAAVPAYAKAHLGWAGRVNGPVDNPISACQSCHTTAQYPVDADLAPFNRACDTDAKKLRWFRNLAGNEPFGKIDAATCEPVAVTPPGTALDSSLQMQVAAQSVLQFHDVNPCAPAEPASAAPGAPVQRKAAALTRASTAPRVSRDGFIEEDEEEP